MFLFLPFWLLPLAMGKVYSSISKTGQHKPSIALEGYISAYIVKCDCQIPHAKIHQNVNFQLNSSSEDIAILVSLRTLLSVTLGKN